MSEMSEMQQVEYAGFGKRLYAYLIDLSIIQVLSFALSYPIGVWMWGEQEQSIENLIAFLEQMTPVLVFLQLLIGLVYGTLMEGGARGATLGKRYCGLRVETEQGGSIGYLLALARNVAINAIGCIVMVDLTLTLLLMPLYFAPLAMSKKQALYDKPFGIVVVRVG